MDPITMIRLGQIRQQEILEQAVYDHEQRLTIIQWSRLLEPLQAFLQRRSSTFRLQSAPAPTALEECPCDQEYA